MLCPCFDDVFPDPAPPFFFFFFLNCSSAYTVVSSSMSFVGVNGPRSKGPNRLQRSKVERERERDKQTQTLTISIQSRKGKASNTQSKKATMPSWPECVAGVRKRSSTPAELVPYLASISFPVPDATQEVCIPTSEVLCSLPLLLAVPRLLGCFGGFFPVPFLV